MIIEHILVAAISATIVAGFVVLCAWWVWACWQRHMARRRDHRAIARYVRQDARTTRHLPALSVEDVLLPEEEPHQPDQWAEYERMYRKYMHS